MRRISRILAIAAILLPFCTHAATLAPGVISGDAIWTKDASPHIVDSVYIPAGASLTIEAGSVVKISQNSDPFRVDGLLVVGDLGREPVIITSLKDDAVLGDDNGDGSASSPQAGDWRTIVVRPGGRMTLMHTELRYGGSSLYAMGNYFYFPMIENRGGTIDLFSVTVSETGHDALLQNSGTTTVIDSVFANVGGFEAIKSIGGTLSVTESTFDTMPLAIRADDKVTIGKNTFTNIAGDPVFLAGSRLSLTNLGGNTGAGGIVLSANVEGDMTLTKDTLPYIVRDIGVPSGASLVIAPGVTVKISDMATSPASFTVSGTLTVGDAVSPERTIITSLRDDSYSGDTNHDGAATLPAEGDWKSITLRPGARVNISNTEIRYGGHYFYSSYWANYFYFPAIENLGAELTLTDMLLADSASYAILQTNGSTTIRDSQLLDSGRYAIMLEGGALSIRRSSIVNSTYGIWSYGAMDARENWWGSATGPTHDANPGGTGTRVTQSVDVSGWLRCDPFANDGNEICASNVLFLPGLEASRLYRPDYEGGTDQLWEPNAQGDASDLYLNEDGSSVRSDIYTKDVVDEVNVIPLLQGNIYKSFLADLNAWKNEDEIINDYGLAPYDWRLSLDDLLNYGADIDERIYYSGDLRATTTPYLIQELRRLASSSRTGKVTIIAHSNGGLLAKALVNKLGDEEAAKLIDALILVAVPQYGTPQAVGALLHGYEQGLPKDWFPAILTPKIARELAHHMQSGYNLLPSTAYWESDGVGVQTPVVTFEDGLLTQQFLNAYGHEIDNPDELRDFLLGSEGRMQPDLADIKSPSILLASLLEKAERTHDNIDDGWSPPPSITIHQIAGWGEDTLGTIRYRTGKECIYVGGRCIGYEPKLEYVPDEVVDGDGTVVTPSALAMSTSSPNVSRWWVNLRNYGASNLGLTLNREHADILEVPQLRTLVKNILIDSNTPLDFITKNQPIPNPDDVRLRFTLHSPLALSAVGANGDKLNSATSTIPGGRYQRYGEVQVLSVLLHTPIMLRLDGYASGSFTLNIEEIDGMNAVIASTTILAIPASTSTVATMLFPDGTLANAHPLLVDHDGDSVTDFSLTPKVGEVVMMPPSEQAYHFSGFLQPIDDTTQHPELNSSVFKRGSTIPVKFQLHDNAGNSLKSETAPLWLAPERLSSMNASVDEPTYALAGTTGTEYRWDSEASQYIYNWSTKGLLSGYWYKIFAKLGDGRTFSVIVGLR